MINQDKFGDMQGFVCKTTRHPTFICNCNSRFVLLKKYQQFFGELKVCVCIFTATKISIKQNKFAYTRE